MHFCTERTLCNVHGNDVTGRLHTQGWMEARRGRARAARWHRVGRLRGLVTGFQTSEIYVEELFMLRIDDNLSTPHGVSQGQSLRIQG